MEELKNKHCSIIESLLKDRHIDTPSKKLTPSRSRNRLPGTESDCQVLLLIMQNNYNFVYNNNYFYFRSKTAAAVIMDQLVVVLNTTVKRTLKI